MSSAALSIYLGIGGLMLDLVGAGLLAYDVLYGPQARLQLAIREARLETLREQQERLERRAREHEATLGSHAQRHASTQDTFDESVRVLQQDELAALMKADHETVAELQHWEQHGLRAQRTALLGLLMLAMGFIAQAVGNVIAAATSGGVES